MIIYRMSFLSSKIIANQTKQKDVLNIRKSSRNNNYFDINGQRCDDTTSSSTLSSVTSASMIGTLNVTTNGSLNVQYTTVSQDTSKFLEVLGIDLGSRINKFLNPITTGRQVIGIEDVQLDKNSSNIIINMIKLRELLLRIVKRFPNNPFGMAQLVDSYYTNNPYNVYSNDLFRNFQLTLEGMTINKMNTTINPYAVLLYDSLSSNTVPTLTDSSTYDNFKPEVIHMTLLKMDNLFFNILYSLNLHTSFRSPLTKGAYNGDLKPTVSTGDVFTATKMFEDMLDLIISLITFIPPDLFTSTVQEFYGEDVTTVLPAAFVTQLSNIPIYMYGSLLSYMDTAAKVLTLISNSQNAPTTFDFATFKDFVVSSSYGLLAVLQLIEEFVKSREFLTVVSVLFPSGALNTKYRNLTNPVASVNNVSNSVDFMYDILRSVYGTSSDPQFGKVIPPETIPYVYDNVTEVKVDLIHFTSVINKLASISILLFGTDTVLLNPTRFILTPSATVTVAGPDTTTTTTTQDAAGAVTGTTVVVSNTDIFQTNPNKVDNNINNPVVNHNSSFELPNGKVFTNIKNYITFYINNVLAPINKIQATTTTVNGITFTNF